MSRHIITNKADYYELLINVTRKEEWEPWVLFMLRCVEETSRWTTDKIAANRELADHTAAFVRGKLPKIYSRELVDLLFEQPYCLIANVVEAGIVGRRAPHRTLRILSSGKQFQGAANGNEV